MSLADTIVEVLHTLRDVRRERDVYREVALSAIHRLHDQHAQIAITPSDRATWSHPHVPSGLTEELAVPWGVGDRPACACGSKPRGTAERISDMTHDTKQTTGAELQTIRPDWALAVIVAEWHQDKSDGMSDYAAHETTRAVVLAWSRHQRDLFPEMRKAADLFEATAHLGTGKGDFRVRVVLANDYVTGGTAYWQGTQSPWHRDVLGGETGKDFATRDAAEAWIAEAPALLEMADGANTANIARFMYQIVESRIEHREKWSMGRGYYLKRGHAHDTGWAVQKHFLWWLGQHSADTIEEIVTAESQQPTRPPASITGETGITFNAEKRGVELRFPAKPSQDVLARLKTYGWRWSRFSQCWHTPDTLEARAFAESLVAELRRGGDS